LPPPVASRNPAPFYYNFVIELLVGCPDRLVNLNSLPGQAADSQPNLNRERLIMKMFILGFAALLATGSAFADTQSNAPVIHDKDAAFVHLDIAKVLGSTDISEQCGTIPAHLNYLDHQGRQHELDYLVQGSGCTNDH
jgi:hypothetical protein